MSQPFQISGGGGGLTTTQITVNGVAVSAIPVDLRNGVGVNVTDVGAGGVQFSLNAILPNTITQVAHKWLDSYSAVTGNFTQSQPGFSDLSGTISAGQISSGTVTWDKIGSAGAALTLSNAGFATTFNQTSAVNWTWANTTAATSGTSQSSPILNLNGTYWTGAASATDSWTVQTVVGNGTNGTSTLTFSHSGTTGNLQISTPVASATGVLPFTTPSGGSFGLLAAGTFGVAGALSGNTGVAMRFYGANASAATFTYSLFTNAASANPSTITLAAQQNSTTTQQVLLAGVGGTGTVAAVGLGGNGGNNSRNFVATAGTQIGIDLCGYAAAGAEGSVQFAPASGSANFVAARIQPTINQTGTSTGNYTALLVNVTETSLKGSANLLLDLQAGATGGTSEFSISNTGIITKYNATATAGIGSTTVFSADSQTALTANYNAGSAKTLIATPVAGGIYRISGAQAINRAATTSSTFPSLTLGYTDAGGIARTITLVSTSTTNTTAVVTNFGATIHASSAAAITLTSASYASSGVTSMQYSLGYTLERMA